MEKKRFGVGLVIACVLALGFSPWVVAEGDPPEPVEVPDVVGLSEADALAAIDAAGLVAEFLETCNDTVPAGDVISQEPIGGTLVDPGSEVDVLVSTGPCPVTEVPNVVGLLEAAALAAIEAAELVGVVEETCSDVVPAGGVISQNPGGGAFVHVGSEVNLLVSTGVCPVGVPDVVGLTEENALAQIAAAGLVGEVSRGCSDTIARGRVAAQDPAAGAMIPPGSVVDVAVAKGACTACDGEKYGWLTPNIKDPGAAISALLPIQEIPIQGVLERRMEVRRTASARCNYDMRVTLDHAYELPFMGADILVDTDLGGFEVVLDLKARGPWLLDVVNYAQSGSNCADSSSPWLGWHGRVNYFMFYPYKPKFAIGGVTLRQVADVCITSEPDCQIINPYVGQYDLQVNVFMPDYDPETAYPAGWPVTRDGCEECPDPGWESRFCMDCTHNKPEQGTGILLGTLLTNHVTDMVYDLVAPAFATAFLDGGEGVLIAPYELQIQTDGCEQMPRAQWDCIYGEGPCSVVGQPLNSTARSGNTLFYLLPVAVMIGLILRRRRG